MYGVIMAGGEGSRLRPLTYTRPKPMMPIAGKPVLSRILELLGENGIHRAALTTMYLPEQIENAYGDAYAGVSLRFFREKRPLGTAGSVRGVLPFLEEDEEDDSFLVISGDALCEFSLRDAIAYHRRQQADVTILLTERNPPNEYGVVQCDADGRILRFLEKPGVTQAFSHTVNTGIYLIRRSVMERVPPSTFCDFGHDLFPALLESGARMMGWNAAGYWCDIGDFSSYYSANRRVAAREGSLDAAQNSIGAHCRIASDAYIADSILFDGVCIDSGCRVEGAILSENVRLEPGAIVEKGAVIGAESVVGAHAVIGAGCRVGVRCQIGKDGRIMDDIYFGKSSPGRLADTGFVAQIGDMSAQYALQVGAALAAAAKRGRIGVCSGFGARSRCVKEAMLCGIASAGSNALDLSPDAGDLSRSGGFAALAAFAAVRLNLALSVCITEEKDPGQLRVVLYDACGLYPARAVERAFSAALHHAAPPAELPGRIERMENVRLLYEDELTRAAAPLEGLPVYVEGEGEAPRSLREALRRAGAAITTSASLRIRLSDDGTRADVSEGNVSADFWHIAALAMQRELEQGVRMLALPYTAPAALEKLASERGGMVMRYSSCPADDRENAARSVASQQFWMRDGGFAAASLCAYLHESGASLASLLHTLPSFAQRSGIYCSDAPELPLFMLGDPAQEGVILHYRQGEVKIIPRREGGYRLHADAVSAEIADELLTLGKNHLEISSRSE